MPMSEAPPPKQGIMNSRSFGAYVEDEPVLMSALAHHASRGGEELRSQNLCARAVMAFIQTNRFHPEHPQYHKSFVVSLPQPTDNTLDLIQAARYGLERIWRPGFLYKKAGVMLLDLVPLGVRQRSLLENRDPIKMSSVMKALDEITRKQGRGAVRFGAEGFRHEWGMKREYKSPAYTTRWDEVLRV